MAVKSTDVHVITTSEADLCEQRDLSESTPAERLQMMWQLTLDAWAFKGEPVGEFRKDVVRVLRPKNK